jgi:hypothetical protein
VTFVHLLNQALLEWIVASLGLSRSHLARVALTLCVRGVVARGFFETRDLGLQRFDARRALRELRVTSSEQLLERQGTCLELVEIAFERLLRAEQMPQVGLSRAHELGRIAQPMLQHVDFERETAPIRFERRQRGSVCRAFVRQTAPLELQRGVVAAECLESGGDLLFVSTVGRELHLYRIGIAHQLVTFHTQRVVLARERFDVATERIDAFFVLADLLLVRFARRCKLAIHLVELARELVDVVACAVVLLLQCCLLLLGGGMQLPERLDLVPHVCEL